MLLLPSGHCRTNSTISWDCYLPWGAWLRGAKSSCTSSTCKETPLTRPFSWKCSTRRRDKPTYNKVTAPFGIMFFLQSYYQNTSRISEIGVLSYSIEVYVSLPGAPLSPIHHLSSKRHQWLEMRCQEDFVCLAHQTLKKSPVTTTNSL